MNEYDRNKRLAKILSSFKKRLRDLPSNQRIDLKKEDEIWSIGQHYGLPTPFLDWTEIPYFAAYFAFYKKNENNYDDNRVAYGLNRDLGRSLLKLKDHKTNELLEVIRKVEFIMNFPYEYHPRLINQRGVFTKAYNGVDIETYVKEFWQKNFQKNNFNTEVILAKILIPNKYRDNVLKSLKSMNITHCVLFPDYSGAVEICKYDLEELGLLKN